MKSSPTNKVITRDYDGIIIDLLDDIVAAETKAQRLVDRLDAISRRPTMRMVDVDAYLWVAAAIAAVSSMAGLIVGYFIRGAIGH